MKKKGLLFTVTTVILLASLVMLAMVFYERNKELSGVVSRSGYGEKLNFVYDDISYDLTDIMGVGGVQISGGTVNITLNTELRNYVDYDTVVADYVAFINGTYAQNNNIELYVSAESNVNWTYGYMDINEDEMYIYNDADRLNGIKTVLKINSGSYSSDHEVTTAGTTSFRVVLLNNVDSVLYDETHLVDPTAENYVMFRLAGGDTLLVKFGKWATNPAGTLHISTDPYTEIRNIEMQFNETIDSAGAGYIEINMGDVNRSADIVLS